MYARGRHESDEVERGGVVDGELHQAVELDVVAMLVGGNGVVDDHARAFDDAPRAKRKKAGLSRTACSLGQSDAHAARRKRSREPPSAQLDEHGHPGRQNRVALSWLGDTDPVEHGEHERAGSRRGHGAGDVSTDEPSTFRGGYRSASARHHLSLRTTVGYRVPCEHVGALVEFDTRVTRNVAKLDLATDDAATKLSHKLGVRFGFPTLLNDADRIATVGINHEGHRRIDSLDRTEHGGQLGHVVRRVAKVLGELDALAFRDDNDTEAGGTRISRAGAVAVRECRIGRGARRWLTRWRGRTFGGACRAAFTNRGSAFRCVALHFFGGVARILRKHRRIEDDDVRGDRAVESPVTLLVANLDAPAGADEAAGFIHSREDLRPSHVGTHPRHRQGVRATIESMACTGAASPAINALSAPSTIRCRSSVLFCSKAVDTTVS